MMNAKKRKMIETLKAQQEGEEEAETEEEEEEEDMRESNLEFPPPTVFWQSRRTMSCRGVFGNVINGKTHQREYAQVTNDVNSPLHLRNRLANVLQTSKKFKK